MAKAKNNLPANFDRPELDLAAEVAAEDQERKHDFLVMLEELSGNTYTAAKALGLSMRQISAWRARDSAFNEQVTGYVQSLCHEMEDIIVGRARDTEERGSTRILAAKTFLEANDERYKKKHETNTHNGNVVINLIIDEPEDPKELPPPTIDAKLVEDDGTT